MVDIWRECLAELPHTYFVHKMFPQEFLTGLVHGMKCV